MNQHRLYLPQIVASQTLVIIYTYTHTHIHTYVTNKFDAFYVPLSRIFCINAGIGFQFPSKHTCTYLHASSIQQYSSSILHVHTYTLTQIHRYIHTHTPVSTNMAFTSIKKTMSAGSNNKLGSYSRHRWTNQQSCLSLTVAYHTQQQINTHTQHTHNTCTNNCTCIITCNISQYQ